ncbi:MAG TPA: hypothetical protein VFM18_13290 [Methanosarcina sp.]|nr:hypothetical protein [Methanosarcina sp.]
MTRLLTPDDRQTLKYEKRMGYAFAVLMVAFSGLLNIYYFCLCPGKPNLLLPGIFDPVLLFLAYFLSYRINLKINRDLKENKKETNRMILTGKEEKTEVQAGSGSLAIPVLGDLFPKLWGQRMSGMRRTFLTAGDKKYEASPELYDALKTGEAFYVHIAPHSGTVLNVTKD